MAAAATPFMDRVHAFTFTHKFSYKPIDSIGKRVLARQRAQLRRAEKWVVDDDAVRAIYHLSLERDRLDSWAFLARLPFDVMWIEMNLHAKVIEMDKKHNRHTPLKDVSKVIGYLFYRDDPNSESPKWICNQFYEFNDMVLPGMIGYVFDPEGSDYSPVRGSTYWRSPTLSLLPGCPKMPVYIGGSMGLDMRVETTADPEILATGDITISDKASITIPAGTDLDDTIDVPAGLLEAAGWATNRFAIIHDPFWQAFQGKFDKRAVLDAVYEEVGHIRFIVAMLASLNSIPKDIKQAVTRTGKRSIGANILPYFQHRTVSLKVPNDNRVMWMRSHMDRAARNAPRPWHPVRGHWRVIELGKASKTHICRHQPVMVESGVGMCEKCQLMIRWIKDHHRGTPEIGIVEHTYKVTT